MPATWTETVGFLIADVHRLFRRRLEIELNDAGLGITAGAARVLAYAAVYRGLRQKDLAERMTVEPMTLVGYLDALEGEGLIERLPDPNDRRCKLIVVTKKAETTIERIRIIAGRIRAEATEGLDEAEIARLRGALLRMRDRLSGSTTGARAAEELAE